MPTPTTHLLLAAALVTSISSAATRAADPIPDSKPHKLELKNEQFLIDSQPIRLIAGEIHPGRIPPELWEDRIKKIKALGLNTVSVYIFWNQIEPKENEFTFEGNTDIRRFLKLCQDNGLWVVFRVGTYVCAEFEFGGYPAWLLKHKTLKLRSDNPEFLAFTQAYVEALAKQTADLQINHGGPILMTQFENEYSRIDPYLYKLHDIFVNAGFDGQLMTCDHSGPVWNTTEWIPGVLRGYNGVKQQQGADRIAAARKVNHGMPVFSPEVYTGWFDLWGKDLTRVSTSQQLSDTQFILNQKDVSFNYYVVDGGTNFGFTAGSNAGRPMMTTYDYDAPIDELGRITPKYKALRELFQKSLHLTDLPPIPADPKTIDIPPITLTLNTPLLARATEKPIESPDVLSMEDINQNFGFVLYKKHFDNGIKGKLTLPVVRDYAFIMIDGKVISEGMTSPPPRNSNAPTETLSTDINHPAPCELEILVHNLGRTSSPFDQAHSRKGLLANPTLDTTPLTHWQIVSLPLDNPDTLPPAPATTPTSLPAGPSLYNATFTLTDTGETYLDLTHFHFGVVWVNGHNLGRFWDVGSCRSLYLPSVWQKKGENQITLLELGTPPASPIISASPKMIETKPLPFAPYWINGSKKTVTKVAGQGDDGNGLQ